MSTSEGEIEVIRNFRDLQAAKKLLQSVVEDATGDVRDLNAMKWPIRAKLHREIRRFLKKD